MLLVATDIYRPTACCPFSATHLLYTLRPSPPCPQVLLVATDIYRPAAIDQLVTLGQRIGVPVFEMGTGTKPPEIARCGARCAVVCCAARVFGTGRAHQAA